MRSVWLVRPAYMLALLIAVALAPATATAGEPTPYGWPNHPWDNSAVPIQAVYPFPGGIANLPPTAWGYQAPFQAVYQFPAVMANQPGAEVIFLWADPTRGLLGGRPYLYHP